MIIERERPQARGARLRFEEEQEEDDAVPALRCKNALSFRAGVATVPGPEPASYLVVEKAVRSSKPGDSNEGYIFRGRQPADGIGGDRGRQAEPGVFEEGDPGKLCRGSDGSAGAETRTK